MKTLTVCVFILFVSTLAHGQGCDYDYDGPGRDSPYYEMHQDQQHRQVQDRLDDIEYQMRRQHRHNRINRMLHNNNYQYGD